jgi:hypothetical protein
MKMNCSQACFHTSAGNVFLEFGGIAIPSYVDGTSLVPLLNSTVSDDTVTDDWRNAILLEGREREDDISYPERDYFAIRTADGLKYIEYRSGFKEFYDLASDCLDPPSVTRTDPGANATGVVSTTNVRPPSQRRSWTPP